MRCEVADHRTRALAEQCALLEGCEGRFVQALAVLMRRAVFTPGQYVTRVDDPSREMYIIGGGEVEVWNEDIAHPRRVIGRGQCFGEISMLFGVKQTHTAFTRSLAVLYAVEREPFEELSHAFLDQVARMRQNALKMGAASLGRSFEGVRAAIRRLEEEQLMRLCYFAGFNDVENMARMLDGGLDVNAADYDGRTALHISASEGHVKATELLLRRGAEAGRRDRWGGTAMQNAVKFGHDSVAAILRQHGARLTDADVGDALYIAASEGDIETLQRYVRNGANPNVCDYDKRTALHLAASEGQLAAVEILLKMGADIDAHDRFGCAPLDDALRGGYEDVANLLREKTLLGATTAKGGGSFVSGGAWGLASSRAGSVVVSGRRRSDVGSEASGDHEGASEALSPRTPLVPVPQPRSLGAGLGSLAEEPAPSSSSDRVGTGTWTTGAGAPSSSSVRPAAEAEMRLETPGGDTPLLVLQAEAGKGPPRRSDILRAVAAAAAHHFDGHGTPHSATFRREAHASLAALVGPSATATAAPSPTPQAAASAARPEEQQLLRLASFQSSGRAPPEEPPAAGAAPPASSFQSSKRPSLSVSGPDEPPAAGAAAVSFAPSYAASPEPPKARAGAVAASSLSLGPSLSPELELELEPDGFPVVSLPPPGPLPARPLALGGGFGSLAPSRAGPGARAAPASSPSLSLPLTREAVARFAGEAGAPRSESLGPGLRRRGGRFTRVQRADATTDGGGESHYAPSEAGQAGQAGPGGGGGGAGRRTVVITPDDVLQRFMHFVALREGIRAHRIRYVFGGSDLVVLSATAPVLEQASVGAEAEAEGGRGRRRRGAGPLRVAPRGCERRGSRGRGRGRGRRRALRPPPPPPAAGIDVQLPARGASWARPYPASSPAAGPPYRFEAIA
eukprot:tig00000073_g1703.t1